MLQLEDFRIANQVYIQPKLGIGNEESNFEFQLLIRSKHVLSVIKAETYLSIVKDIYYEHYYAWYSVIDPAHESEYKKHIDDQFEYLVNQLQGHTEVDFVQSNPICEFYRASDCHFHSSTAGFVAENTKNRPILLFGIPIMICVEIFFSIIIFIILKKFSIDTSSFAPIFTAITALCTCIFTVAFTRIKK